MPRRPRPATRREDVARLSRAGYTVEEIATRLDCHPRTVQRFRRALGLSQPPEHHTTAVSEEKLERAREMLDDGASRTEVCRTLHMTWATIDKYFPGTGWTREQVAEHAVLCRRLKVA